MTTLKEKLDGKLPHLSTLMWNELEKVFLEVKPEDLLEGVKVAVYKNDSTARFSYNPTPSKSSIGKKFSRDYDFDTFLEVIKIAEENGLKVESLSKTHYEFIYSPTWPK